MSVLAAACGRRIYAAEAATATEAQAAACWLGSLGLFLFRSTAPPMAEAAADHNKTGGTGEKYNRCRLCLRACTYICYKSEEKKIPINEKKII